MFTKATPTDLLVWGIMAHWVADWIFQNQWIADNKKNLKHPAGWVHGAIHAIGLAIVFPIGWAIGLAITHVLIDTRVPLNFWKRLIKQTRIEDPDVPPFPGPQDWAIVTDIAIWNDQVLHILLIAMAALLVGRVG